jgi:tetratricopeptide (TPR) repeat protein
MKRKKLLQIISPKTSPEKVMKAIAFLRESKGGEEQAIEIVNKALDTAHDYVVTLHLEKALIFQHEVMEERNKPISKQDKKKTAKYIKKMVESTEEAEVYVKRYGLKRWQSRIYRFLGRAADYDKDYPKAIKYYKKAIKFAKDDSEYILEKIPRWLEYEAFLAYSILMSGEIEKGLKMSKEVYKKFIDTKEGKFLKKKDFPTWAIWITGIPIRVGFWFIENGEGISKEDLLKWLKSTEGYLKIPTGSERWIGKVDFQFRKNEIVAIKKKLESY